MGGPEGIVDIDLAESGETGAEIGNGEGIGGFFGAVWSFGLAFFLDVEAEIFEEDDASWLEGGAGGFGFWADAFGEELDWATEEFGEFFADWAEGEFLDVLAIGAAEMTGEDDRAAFFEDQLDGGDGGGDPLGIGDGAGHLIERDIEVDANEDALACEVEGAQRELRHKEWGWRGLEALADDIFDEIDAAVAVAPLVVIPADQFEEAVIEFDAASAVED